LGVILIYMKISENFYQFKDEKALIIISGTEEAKIFEGENGIMNSLGSINAQEIKYSDKEGFFASRVRGISSALKAKGIGLGSGSTLKDVNRKERTEFLKMLGKKYGELKNNGYDYIALTAPSHALPEIIDCLNIPKGEVEKTVNIIKKGNYLDYSPEKILGIITEKMAPLAKK